MTRFHASRIVSLAVLGVSDGPGDRRLDGVDVGPGERVYASLWPVGGGFAELALALADRLTPCPTG